MINSTLSTPYPSTTMNLNRTRVIAANVFREVIRDRALYLLVFFATVMVVAVALLPEVAASAEEQMILDVGLAAIGVLGLAVAAFVGTGLVNREIEKRTVYAMIAKPVSRSEFIVGKHWGLTAVLAVLVLAMTAIYIGILTAKQIPVSIASVLLSALFQILELALVAAVALLFGVLTSSLLATMLTIAIYCVGHLSRDLLSIGALTDNAELHQITEVLFLLLPDLSRLNLKNQAVYGMEMLPPPAELLSHAGYGLLYTLLLLTLTVGIFSRRQF
ncbi:ABC transporter permease [Thermocoleostomius sinensis]|uniref:ABC transporter permease n=1 Tax=Thermocoleostomius sinensis A174 TaxID=2016057 RepID=A0A9E8ZJR4_9CYAN|nr:ABC transporter permease [Thermocoleostomius sinensis]WAL62498.1 ABC transporter permease [Thermocoleostomius sinensis A174]